MTNSNLAALDVAFFSAVADGSVIPFNPEWNNGTGYLDGAVKDAAIASKADGLYASYTGMTGYTGPEPIDDRKVLIAVKDGKVYIAFERSSKAKCGRVAYNSPHREAYDHSEGLVAWMLKYAM
jgi:hypothetical protein